MLPRVRPSSFPDKVRPDIQLPRELWLCEGVIKMSCLRDEVVLAQQWDSSAFSFTRFWFAKGFFLPVPCLGKWSLQDVTYQPSQLHFSSPQKSWELSTTLTSLLPTQEEISSLPSHTHHEGPNSVSPLTRQSDPCMHCVGSQAEFWVPFIAPPRSTPSDPQGPLYPAPQFRKMS